MQSRQTLSTFSIITIVNNVHLKKILFPLEYHSKSIAYITTMSLHEFPEFAIETIRLRTFEEWPLMMKQTPKEMSDAGFFYTQISDRVICFSCGGGIWKWDKHDDPWEQHAAWNSNCKYVLLVKGPEYVASVNARIKKETGNEPTQSSKVKRKQTKNNNKKHKKVETNDSRLCRICYENEYNTIFLPCSHIMACAKCALAQEACPICREKFEKITRIYLP